MNQKSGRVNHKTIFNNIYRHNSWGGGSGPGSTIANTVQYRWFIQNFVAMNAIKSVVDIGCGDWQFSQRINWNGIRYLGLDVSDVVLSNTRRFAADGIEFREINAISDDLPSADLAIVKDVLQHWNNDDIIKFLPKLENFKTALITNGFPPNLRSAINKNISTGNVRPVDLRAPPFNLKGNYVFWYKGDEPKFVFCWNQQ